MLANLTQYMIASFYFTKKKSLIGLGVIHYPGTVDLLDPILLGPTPCY